MLKNNCLRVIPCIFNILTLNVYNKNIPLKKTNKYYDVCGFLR